MGGLSQVIINMILNLEIKVHCLCNSELVYRNIKHAPGASQLHSPWKALRKAHQGKYTRDLLLFLLVPFLLWTSSTNELVQKTIYLHLGLTRLENIYFYNWIIGPAAVKSVKGKEQPFSARKWREQHNILPKCYSKYEFWNQVESGLSQANISL